MNREELDRAIEDTKLEIYRLKYQLGETVAIKKEREIHKRLRELQILHYWQLEILKRLDKE
ncbi:hypothetical protein [Desulforamulus aquiferis]|nr:hypothetical protein [Desulforamulus aquiferis]